MLVGLMGTSAFYFDLFSPTAYLAAERVLATVQGPCPWQPILARTLPGAESFEAYRCETEMLAARESVELRAHALGLQPIRLAGAVSVRLRARDARSDLREADR